MKAFDSIGRYEIQRRLGTGGMGSVYLARDTQLDRLVAIKLLKGDYSDDAELRQRFNREARSIARLRHPNIVTVFDVGEHDGRPFMAMEYIAGGTLTAWLRRSPPPPLPRRLALVEELCAGLAHAHEAGMVHRDIKPNNLMLDADGVLKILDFGIARARDSGDSGMTQAGMMLGSLNYMSPEQVTGGNVDHRADVFAAGVVLYEVIALEQAFSGSIDSGVLHRIMTVGPVPLQERVPGVDPDLVRITGRALARDPGDRYQHANEMRTDLAAVRRRLDLELSATAVVLTPARSKRSSARTPAPSSRPAKTGHGEAALRARQVEEHVQAARRALEAGDYRVALERAERSALLEPGNSAVIGLLERARFEYHAAAVRQALIEAKQLLAEGSLDRAAALIERVPSLSGPEPRAIELNDQVAGLSREIGQAREEQSRRHARERYEKETRTRPPWPPPPTAAGDADENAPQIVVRLAGHRGSSRSPRSGEAVELVGRDRELQALVHRILRSHGGSFLVTGYRGVGKTSFVNGVVRRLDDEARSEPGLRLLIVRINLPKPIEPLMLLKTMLRSLAHELAAADLQQRLAPHLRRQIEEAVERTSDKVVRRVSEDAEAGVGVGDAMPGWSPVKLSANVKRGRSHSKERVSLDYVETDIERDLVSLARQLGRTSLSVARPWYRRLWPLRAPRDEAVRVRIVFIFDELDKLEELSLEDGSPATVTMDPVFATLKTLLTESELTFVFVAGRDLQERLEQDMRRGDSIYRSVFAGRWYLGCLWSAIDRVYTHHLAGEHDEEQSRALAAFSGYIRYKARGLPRLAIDTFEDHVEWGREPCLRFSPVQLRRFKFFAALHAWIEEQFEHSGPLPLDDDGQVDADRSRMAAYYAVDDVLRRGKREFTSDELRASIEALSVKVTPAKADLDRFVGRVIHLLEAGAYIERVGEQGDDRQIWEGPRVSRATTDRGDGAEMRQAPRFRVTIGRLAELGGRAEGQRRGAASGAGDKPVMIQSFEIYEVVGEGASAVVYRARDLRRGTVAALKVLRPDVADSPAAQARLEREGTVLDRLQHPAIVRLIERGTERGRPYIAMEFVPGLSLKRVLQNRARLNAELAGAVAARLADALQHVHDRGFVRTDLSPRHVMVTPDGELRIIDLGIAKQESVETSLTQVGVVLGTPGYLPPEGWNGLPLDPRSDVYTLGVMLYEMVTGALPFAGSSRGELGLAHLNRKPIPPAALVQIPESLDAAILRCLEKDREARFPSMTGLSASLPRMDELPFKQQLRALVASDQERIEAVEAFTVYQRPPAAASSPGPTGGEPARTIRVRRAAGDVSVRATGSPRGAPAMRARFRVVEGGRESMQELVLEGARTIIGRGEFSDIVLPGSGVSRSHAAVFMRDSHCWIEDLNSQNGVFVNDERISEPQRLGRGDRIRIGEFLLQFEPATAPDSPNAQPPETTG